MELSEALALTKNNDNDGWGNIWSNPFIYLIWFAFLRNGGLFGNSGEQYATAQQVREINDNQTLMNKLDQMGANEQNGFTSVNTGVQAGFNNIGMGMVNGFNGVQSAIADSRYAQQSCCCETNRNIDSLKAENYQNTCAITNAVHSEGEQTRAAITDQTIQGLRDALADRDRQLLASNLLSAQQAQTANLIAALRPFPQPAYITSSPYASAGTCAYAAG